MTFQSCHPATIKLLPHEGALLDDALSFFYNSKIYSLISEGVSDLHCMSDEYLTQELIFEYMKIE